MEVYDAQSKSTENAGSLRRRGKTGGIGGMNRPKQTKKFLTRLRLSDKSKYKIVAQICTAAVEIPRQPASFCLQDCSIKK